MSEAAPPPPPRSMLRSEWCLRPRRRYGEAPGQFMLPRGVALCGEQLLVAEEGGKRVQVLMRNGAPRGQLREPCFGGLLGICVDPTER
jgi:hypothetical protein